MQEVWQVSVEPRRPGPQRGVSRGTLEARAGLAQLRGRWDDADLWVVCIYVLLVIVVELDVEFAAFVSGFYRAGVPISVCKQNLNQTSNACRFSRTPRSNLH